MATLRIAFLSALVLELLATLGVALVAVSVGLRLVFGEMALAAGADRAAAGARGVLAAAPRRRGIPRRAGRKDGRREGVRAARHRRTPAGGTRPVTAAGAPIRLENVSVAGRDGTAPHGLTRELAPGSVTVLTGPNGAGKTTACRSILGLTRPTSGRVSSPGSTSPSWTCTRWWRQVAWLAAASGAGARHRTREPGAVRSHRRPRKRLPRERVSTRCWPTLPDGLDTVIGRDGVGLSLGQRQRLGLARVLGSRRRCCCSTSRRRTWTPSSRPGCCAPSSNAHVRGRPWSSSATAIGVIAIGDGVVYVGGESLLRDAVALLRPRRPRLALAVALGVLSLGSALALAGVSAWLITRAWQMPPVLDLSVAVVAVRALGISRGVLGYCERLASHDTALRAAGTARAQLYRRLADAPAEAVMRLQQRRPGVAGGVVRRRARRRAGPRGAADRGRRGVVDRRRHGRSRSSHPRRPPCSPDAS